MANIRPYIVINGINSQNITGLIISELPPITKPQMRVTAEEIDGRDGDIVTALGFSAYDKEIEIGLAGNYDVDEVIEFFTTSGIITFSNEPDKYYRFAQYDGIDFDKLVRFKKAKVSFHCQPFKFSTTEGIESFSSSPITITNSGNTESRPDILVNGSGAVSIGINGSEVLSLDMTENPTIVIDSESMNAYGAQSQLLKAEAEFEPVLDTNGYGSVWIGGAGENKCNMSEVVTATSAMAYGLTVTKNESTGVITLSGTPTWSTTGVKQFKMFGLAGAYVAGYSCAVFDVSLSSNLSDLAYVTTESDDYFSMRVTVSSLGDINISFKPVLYAGNTTPAEWTPYENIGEISGWSEANVVATSKNLLSLTQNTVRANRENGITINSIDDNSINMTSQAANYRCFGRFIYLKAGTYTLSFKATSSDSYTPAITIYNSNGGVIVLQVFQSSPKHFTITEPQIVELRMFVTGTNDATIRTVSFYDIQLELGSTATAFEPYGACHTVDFGQTVYGGKIDLVSGLMTISNVCHRIPSSIDAVFTSMRFTNTGCLEIRTPITHKTGSNYMLFNLKCSHFKEETFYDVNVNGVNGCSQQGNWNVAFLLRDDSLTSLADWQTFLTNNNVQLCWELATPITEQLTGQEITALLGNNVVFSDMNGDVNVRYYQNREGDIQEVSGSIVSFTIDSMAMNNILLNRKVTGDYDQVKLNKGSNTITFSGDVAQVSIDKYSRWL